MTILYEDDALLAVDKPAGLVVHPTYKNVSGTLLDQLRARSGDWPATDNPTIVGRLDKGTSGIVIVAKRPDVHAAMQRILWSTATEKVYAAVVAGDVDVPSGTIALPLRIDASDRRRVIVDHRNGSPSETRFERIAAVAGRTLLHCRLITGRRHQLRVHLAASGWPVVGDHVYGQAIEGFSRLALHAWRVSFVHPTTGDPILIESPVPLEVRGLLPGYRAFANT